MQGIPDIIQNPKFLAAYELIGGASWKNPLSDGNDTYIFFVQNGRGECLYNDMIISITGGEIIILPTGARFEIKSSTQSPISGTLISFAGLSISGLPDGFLAAPNKHPVIQLDRDFSSANRFFSDIYNEFQFKTYGSEEMIQSLLNALIVLILRKLYDIFPDTSSSITTDVKKYIEENYDQDLTLSDLASVVFVSPYHLAHVYKEEMGISPIQYLIRFRIEEAKRLLKHSNLTIREIASKIGYPNGIYFNLIFKKMTGMPPGKFRKSGDCEVSMR
ncbi:helix-turn-helix transcriptional regulator [Paenibacillus abyssi]|uniref:HTH araC/xylS-type domain-containing protein n=1 Tax=Paenibacillus abyssi TaxID=1340531 RepID=A0A917CXU3_9BACL|nr:AraC family transcriptional regulator [Paenibacillus abyssi]GGG01776.1 hypothetical protein GCM10010916_18670 [Paenibacillus abyssi]